MTIPHTVRIAALVFASTGFYTYVGQMVPQKEVLPPQETVIRADLTTADMVKVGREVMDSKGLCFTCHTIGRSGALRFPDLDGVGDRAKTRVAGMNDVEYFAQTLYDPNAYIVPGFNPGMPTINKPPIGLSDQEILCVIAYLQSLGSTPTVTLQTSHRYYSPPGATAAPATTAGAPGAPPAGAPAPGAAPAAGSPPAAGAAPAAPAASPTPPAAQRGGAGAPGLPTAPAGAPAPGVPPPQR
jgi:cytochrome c2